MSQKTRRADLLRRGVPTAAFLLLIAACGGTTTATTGAAETTSTVVEATTTSQGATTTTPLAPETTVGPDTTIGRAQLPESSATAILGVGANSTYKLAVGTFTPMEFDESELPVAPGSAEVRWYRSGDRYVVAYVGVDPAETGPLCPGNSILATDQFENVTNAPTEEGACEGFVTVTSDPEVGPRACGGHLLYVTAIPSDEEGTLFASLEASTDGGAAIIGLTSQVMTNPDIPEIDLAAICG